MIKLIEGDCMIELPKLPAESVDMLITDPPYGINYQSKRCDTPCFPKIKNDKAPFIWFIGYLYYLLKIDGGILMFSRWDVQQKFIDALQIAGFKVKNVIIWDKKRHGMGDLKTTFAPQYETVIYAVKGNRNLRGKRPHDVLSFSKVLEQKIVHPNEKPISLLETLITHTTDKGNTILDCFMGSGTTGVACVNLDRNFIGIEMDHKYFEIANKRIGQAKNGDIR